MTKCLKLIVFLLVSANPRLLGALRKTVLPVGVGWKNEWNVFVRVSLHFESRSRKALEKQYLFWYIRYSFFFFFCLMQETVRCSRYIIWLTFYIERVSAPHSNNWSFMFS